MKEEKGEEKREKNRIEDSNASFSCLGDVMDCHAYHPGEINACHGTSRGRFESSREN